ncbi:hypothetical protein MKW92_014070 [Papaver armeniacum]|nr:hypothetical protein MKW92_014070 [Papaver armeniacum]
MGKRASTKKNPVRNSSENNGDDVLLKDMLLEDQNQIMTVHQNGTVETGLTEVAILEDNDPSSSKNRTADQTTQLTEVAVVEVDRSIQSSRRSMRLLGAPADDVGIQSGSGTRKRGSGEIERLFKIVQEQQLRIDEMAAEKSLARQDQTSVAEIEDKENPASIRPSISLRKKIQGLEQNQNELTRKFENANSKLEGYELGQRNICEIIDKLKDAAYFQSLSIELPSTSKNSRTPKHPVHTKRQPTAPKTRKRKVTDIVKPPAAPKTRATASKRKRV